jgi:tetratricopeptide (TPR) repeat protein
MPSIFISHTHADKAIADAISVAVDDLLQHKVEVRYSTSHALNGGIPGGDDWVGWINTQVSEAKVSLILLTPSSVQKPWVLWEAGAVRGAALATVGGEARRVVPMKFKLGPDDVPTPFAHSQMTDGLSPTDMAKFFGRLAIDFSADLTDAVKVEAGQRIESVLKTHLGSVDKALRFAPMTVTEAAVQEWLARIDDLDTGHRYAEVEQLNDWMNIAFGRQEGDRRRALDPRLHRRVGALYSRARKPAKAAEQYEMARQLAPRDVYVLRNLGKAYLDQNRGDKAGEVIEAIETLDPQAFTRNAENAALKARWQREGDNLVGARETLERALERNLDSYYLAVALASVLLALKDADRARETYQRVLEIIDRSHEKSVWSLASALTAAVALGDEPRWRKLADVLRTLSPTPEDRQSIERGLADVAESLGIGPVVGAVRAALDKGP